ncbi:hypothetical protein SPSYN_00475 [Sporotomaculum syntrophicum]|uniref:Uncharacterized protein n=1 Tax=Sporotomaculum syntrophicum TaxID=182264 RepID=A0A9D3AZP8_9FIRM|nr:hypothetical protein [Sporotomaculum syntrophicum]KAF1086756.1 hypothetical protein SPSYN_00475 [Sporotomaculum syntrophicum]
MNVNNLSKAASSRWLRKVLRSVKMVFICLLMIFSPVIVWVILSLNRELIVILANWEWLSNALPGLLHTLGEHVNTPEFARGFNEAALGGLLTLFGVIVTVWYYQVIRVQEVTEKRLFIIDELLEELKKNRSIINDLAAGNSESYNQYHDQYSKSIFFTEAWHKLGGDVALLPRRLYLRLSVLYSCLNRCTDGQSYWKNKATIDRINGIISDLHKYRGSLSKTEIA